METLKRFAQRGHKERSEEIDETSGKWKARAGRTEGPDTYQAGDLCRAIFRHACALSHRERNNVYGGSVILVGIAAARGVPLPEGSKQICPNAYCSVVPLDRDGKEIRTEVRATRCIQSDCPQWDEVFPLLSKTGNTDLSEVGGVRIKLRHYESRWKPTERISSVDISLDDLQLSADANLGRFIEGWRTTVRASTATTSSSSGGAGGGDEDDDEGTAATRDRSGTAASGGGGGGGGFSSLLSRAGDFVRGTNSNSNGGDRSRSGSAASAVVEGAGGGGGGGGGVDSATAIPGPSIHVYLCLHRPPPDPQPVAVHVRLVEARDLLMREKGGGTIPPSPYVRVKPLNRLDQKKSSSSLSEAKAAKEAAAAAAADEEDDAAYASAGPGTATGVGFFNRKTASAKTQVPDPPSCSPLLNESVLFFDPKQCGAYHSQLYASGAGAGGGGRRGSATGESELTALPSPSPSGGAAARGGGGGGSDDGDFSDNDEEETSGGEDSARGNGSPAGAGVANSTGGSGGSGSRSRSGTSPQKEKAIVMPGAPSLESLGVLPPSSEGSSSSAASSSNSNNSNSNNILFSRRQAIAVDLTRSHFLSFKVRDKAASGEKQGLGFVSSQLGKLQSNLGTSLLMGGLSDSDLGEVLISFADLWGDEDAVISESSLRVQKWFRLRTTKKMDKALEGALGHLRLDITLCFDPTEVRLLPPGWSEATDRETGLSYFHHKPTGASTWDEPPELIALRASALAAAAAAMAANAAASGAAAAAEGNRPRGDSEVTAGPSASSSSTTPFASPLPPARQSISSSSSNSMEQRYRRGSLDALMFLTTTSSSSSSSSGMMAKKTSRGSSSVTATATATATIAEDVAGEEAGSDSSSSSGSGSGSADRGVRVQTLKTSGGSPPTTTTATATAAGSDEGKAASARKKAPVKATVDGDDAEGINEKGGDDDDFDPEAAAAALEEMDLFGSPAANNSANNANKPADFSNPLASVTYTAGQTKEERMKAMAAALAKEKEEKKRAEEALLAAKLRAMTPEERAEYEASQQREARREQRKSRMLHSQFTAYGSGAGKARLSLAGHGRGALLGPNARK